MFTRRSLYRNGKWLVLRKFSYTKYATHELSCKQISKPCTGIISIVYEKGLILYIFLTSYQTNYNFIIFWDFPHKNHFLLRENARAFMLHNHFLGPICNRNRSETTPEIGLSQGHVNSRMNVIHVLSKYRDFVQEIEKLLKEIDRFLHLLLGSRCIWSAVHFRPLIENIFRNHMLKIVFSLH